MAFRNLALLIGTTIVVLLVGELLVRSLVPVRNVGPVFSTYDSVLGKRLKPSFTAKRYTPEFDMVLTTNQSGFRGPELPQSPSNSVLFIGDSFTMGYGVNDGEEFPAIVRAALNRKFGEDKIPVINAGIGNNGNGRWIKFLRHEAANYSPQIVLLQPLDNDFYENVRENLFSLSDSGSLIEHGIPPPSLMRRIQNVVDEIPLLEYSYLFALVRQVISHSRTSRSTEQTNNNAAAITSAHQDDDDPVEDLTLALIEQAIVLCRESGWPVKMLLIDLPDNRLRAIQSVLDRHNVEAISFPGKNERPDFYYENDGHWNAAGHRDAAQRVLGVIEDKVTSMPQ